MGESKSLDWEPTSSYSEFLRGVVDVCYMAWTQMKQSDVSYWNFVKGNSPGLVGVSFVLATALGLTILRSIITRKLFQPLAKFFHTSPSSQVKVSESMWKLMVYTFTFSWAFYSAVLRRPFFQRPSTMFLYFETDTPTPLDIDLLYGLQIAFYLHALYTLFFVDTWKRDSALLVFHHIIALFLLISSFLMKCSPSGLLILLLHDCCDIPLELSKVVKTLAVQKGKSIFFMEQVATVLFVLFAITWCVSRLYFYPLRMIHYTSRVILTNASLSQMSLIFPSYLLTLFLIVINVYWTALIIRLIWNVFSGRMAKLDDIRDIDVVTDVRQLSTDKNSNKKGV